MSRQSADGCCQWHKRCLAYTLSCFHILDASGPECVENRSKLFLRDHTVFHCRLVDFEDCRLKAQTFQELVERSIRLSSILPNTDLDRSCEQEAGSSCTAARGPAIDEADHRKRHAARSLCFNGCHVCANHGGWWVASGGKRTLTRNGPGQEKLDHFQEQHLTRHTNLSPCSSGPRTRCRERRCALATPYQWYRVCMIGGPQPTTSNAAFASKLVSVTPNARRRRHVKTSSLCSLLRR